MLDDPSRRYPREPCVEYPAINFIEMFDILTYLYFSFSFEKMWLFKLCFTENFSQFLQRILACS